MSSREKRAQDKVVGRDMPRTVRKQAEEDTGETGQCVKLGVGETGEEVSGGQRCEFWLASSMCPYAQFNTHACCHHLP